MSNDDADENEQTQYGGEDDADAPGERDAVDQTEADPLTSDADGENEPRTDGGESGEESGDDESDENAGVDTSADHGETAEGDVGDDEDDED